MLNRPSVSATVVLVPCGPTAVTVAPGTASPWASTTRPSDGPGRLLGHCRERADEKDREYYEDVPKSHGSLLLLFYPHRLVDRIASDTACES